jgi:5-methylcytosine-specific restriction endonuclease McrA
MNFNEIKKVFNVDDDDRISVTKVTNGWNVRILKKYRKKESFTEKILKKSSRFLRKCCRCGKTERCHPHHIIPKSAGGKDDFDNFISLCFDCHVGNDGIHNGKWKIESIVGKDTLNTLSKEYNTRYKGE